MTNNDKHNWAERWVLRVGKSIFVSGKYAKYLNLILIIFATMYAFMAILGIKRGASCDEAIASYCLAMTLALALLAITNFERRHFYRIIQEQKEQIEQLEKELHYRQGQPL